MIKILGTNHLMSKGAIEGMIKDENPDVIAVELCDTRYNLMVKPILENYEVENKEDNSLIGKISNTIKQKAEQEDVQYGSDQINACIFAVENNLPLEFVDLDITKIKELLEKIPKEEKDGFLKELLAFETKTLKESIENIDVDKTLREMKEKFPIAFEFLINLRNLVILNNLFKLERKYKGKRILVLLGKGHVKIIEDGLQ